MDTRVEILRTISGTDSHGQPNTARELVAIRWAKVEPQSGAERFTSATEIGEVVYRVTLRRDSVTATLGHGDALQFGDTVLDIDAPIKSKDRRAVVVVGRG